MPLVMSLESAQLGWRPLVWSKKAWAYQNSGTCSLFHDWGEQLEATLAATSIIHPIFTDCIVGNACAGLFTKKRQIQNTTMSSVVLISIISLLSIYLFFVLPNCVVHSWNSEVGCQVCCVGRTHDKGKKPPAAHDDTESHWSQDGITSCCGTDRSTELKTTK